MIFKPLLIVLIVGALLILLAVVCGCGHRSKFCMTHFSPAKKVEWITKRIAKELDLNDQQKEKLGQIRDEIIAKQAEMRQQKEELINAFISEIPKDTLNLQFLKDLLQEKHQDMEQMYDFTLARLEEFHAILAPQQRQKLAERINEFHNKLKN